MIEVFDNFLMKAFLSGILIAFAAAPLGCFVVWKKMAYFGDALAQASILGVALSLSFSFSIFFWSSNNSNIYCNISFFNSK